MSAKQLMRLFAVLPIFFLMSCTATTPDKKEQQAGQTLLTVRKIIELAADKNRDGVSEVVQQISAIYSDVAQEERRSPYGIDGARMLADGAVITNALLWRTKRGVASGFTIRLSRVGCYPLADVLSAAYLEGPYYRKDGIEYVRKTLWVDMSIDLDVRRKCVVGVSVGHPNNSDSFYKSLRPIAPNEDAAAGSMEDALKILASSDSPAVMRVNDMIAAGYTRLNLKDDEAGVSDDSLLADGTLVEYAHQYAPDGRLFAIELLLSDEPCYPLWRALEITGALRSSDAESGEAYRSISGHDLRIIPHLRSPGCVGWISAAPGANATFE